MTDVHRIEFEVDWPPFHAAAYLVDGEEPVLVDAGAPGDRGWSELKAGLAAAGLVPADVAHLLVTHPHTDHCGQAGTVVDAADPTVYALAGVSDRLSMDSGRLAERVQANAAAIGLDDERVESHVERAVSSLERNRACLPPSCIDVSLADGDRFAAGGVSFEAVHTPGHQRDHACFAAGDRLFSGDAVIEPFRAAALDVGLDDGTFDSIAAFYRGYDRLSEWSFDRIYPGHGPVFEDFAGAVEDGVGNLNVLVEGVASTLGDLGEATPAAVDDARVDEPRDYHLFETVGGLGSLEREGRAAHRVEDGVRVYDLRE